MKEAYRHYSVKEMYFNSLSFQKTTNQYLGRTTDSDDPFLARIWHRRNNGDSDQVLLAGIYHRIEYLHSLFLCTPATSWRFRREFASVPLAFLHFRSVLGQHRTYGTRSREEQLPMGSRVYISNTDQFGNVITSHSFS